MSRILPLLLVLLSLLAHAPNPAWAGDAAAPEAEDDLEILVTASRVEEELEDVAADAVVLTREELSAAGQLTLVEALETLAGIQFRSYSGNAAQAVISMGGFSENSHGRVLVLLDGRRLNMPDMRPPNWLQIPVENVERVEILRGAHTVMYGDNALGGVINIITRRGAEDLEVEVTGSGGSFATHQEAVSVRGAAGERLRYSLSGQYGASEGYRERSGYESAGGGAGLEMDLGEALAGSLSLSYDRLSYEMPGALTEAQMAADPTQSVNPADESEEQYLNTDLGLSALTKAGLLELDASYTWKYFVVDMTSWLSFWNRTYHSLGLTPRISTDFAPGGLENRLVAGADFYYDILGYESYTSAARTVLSRAADLSKTSFGAYLSDDLSLSPVLTLSGGVRGELARLAIKGTETITLDEQVLHSAFSGSGALLYRPGESSKLYVRYERVYRLPFLDEQIIYQGFPDDAFYADLEPERGHHFELGGELAPAAGFSLAASVYLLDMEDEIAWSGDLITGRNENLNKTRHYGGECTLKLRAGEILELSGGYAYTRAVHREGALEGKELVLVPNHSADGTATAFLPLGFSLTGSLAYTGESYKDFDADNAAAPLDGYMVFDLLLRYRPGYVPGSLEITVGIKNLLDRRYSTWAEYGFVFGDTYYPAPGRSWTVGGSYRY